MKLAVIYDSVTGNTKKAAEWIAEGMKKAGADARAFALSDIDKDFVSEAKGVVIGCPSYMAAITPKMREWLMGAGKLGMAGKLGGAFSTVQYTHGGGELVIQISFTFCLQSSDMSKNKKAFRILCREAAKNGITVLHDSIAAGNNVAIKLFISEGFEIVRKTDKEVLLRKQLKTIDKNVKIVETGLTPEVLDLLIELSKEWENENSCHGYRANTKEDIEGNRIFLAKNQGRVIGYLFGHVDKTKEKSSVIDKNVPYFEIEELYVRPEFRDWKVGKKLFRFVEKAVSNEAEYLMLSTATKNWRSILHFYIDELGMDFWNARLFKKLGKE